MMTAEGFVPDLAFRKTRDVGGWLSNMSAHPVTGDGVTWRTAEAWFQAMRFPKSGPGAGVRDLIHAQIGPMQAKFTAKKYAEHMVVVPRSEEDLENMRRVLAAKCLDHPNLRNLLTATGNARLIEDVSARPNESGLFWGMRRTDDGYWVGQNWLGRLWMEIR